MARADEPWWKQPRTNTSVPQERRSRERSATHARRTLSPSRGPSRVPSRVARVEGIETRAEFSPSPQRDQPRAGIQLQAIAKWAMVSVFIMLAACCFAEWPWISPKLWVEAVFSRVINREDPFHGGYVSLLVQRARNGWSLPKGTTPEDLLRALNGRMVVDLRSQYQEDDGQRRLPSTETPSSEVATVEATSAWLRSRLPPFRSGRVVYSALTSVSRMELSLLEQSQVGTISTNDLAAFVFVWETEPELCVDEPGGEPDKHRAFIRHRYGDAVHVVFLCWWDGVYTNQDWSRQGMQALDRALLIQRRQELT